MSGISAGFEAALVEPDKHLFIEMLTRDVELVPAILDLWDNSVDAAIRFVEHDGETFKPGSLNGFRVDINVSSGRFEISDNCGGMPLTVARDYAFRLGRDPDAPTVEGAVGSFGVGMKRTLFKMGSNFRVESSSTQGSFALEVNVPTWAELEEDVWTFPFERADADESVADPKMARTEVKVWDLSESVAGQFDDAAFLGRLRRELQMRRPEAYDLGIETTLNGDPLTPQHAVLKSSQDFRPLVKRLRLANDVRVEIHAGLVAGPRDQTVNPEDDGDAEKFVGHDEAGWYVLANGRVLLAADRTRLTGWGDDAPRYHPQFRNFRGYADIRCNDARYLPWNTSKTGVDESSFVWKAVYGAMRTALAEVQVLATRIKEDRTVFRQTEVKSKLLEAFESAQERPIERISQRQDSTLHYPTEQVEVPQMSRINFAVEPDRFRRAADYFEVETGPDLGRALFEYFWSLEIRD